MTSCLAMVVFLCSPTGTRGVEPAMSCRARWPAVTMNSNELGNLLRSIMVSSQRTSGRFFRPRPHLLQFGSLCQNDAPQAIDGRRELVVYDQVVVFGEARHLVARHLQAPLNGCFAVLAASAKA